MISRRIEIVDVDTKATTSGVARFQVTPLAASTRTQFFFVLTFTIRSSNKQYTSRWEDAVFLRSIYLD